MRNRTTLGQVALLIFMLMVLQAAPLKVLAQTDKEMATINCGLNIDSVLNLHPEYGLEVFFDSRAFLARSLNRLALAENEAREIRAQLGKGFNMASGLQAFLAEGGSAELANTYTLDERELLLFRLISANGHLSYQEMLLSPNPNCQVIDIYDFQSGEWLSHAVGRSIALDIGAVPSGNNQWDTWQILADAQQMLAKGKPNEIPLYLDLIPKKTRNSRQELRLRLWAEGRADSQQAKELFDRYEQNFGTDPALELLRFHLLWGQAGAEAVVAQINRLIGMLGDPYLHLLKAEVLAKSGNAAAAKASLNRLLAEGEQETSAYLMLIDLAYAAEAFEEMADHLQSLAQLVDLPINLVLDKNDYPKFFSSNAYKKANR